jgi:hypothetical protein
MLRQRRHSFPPTLFVRRLLLLLLAIAAAGVVGVGVGVGVCTRAAPLLAMAITLLTRRARIALGTATQCSRRNDSPQLPAPPPWATRRVAATHEAAAVARKAVPSPAAG